jgi:O-antigen ligase
MGRDTTLTQRTALWDLLLRFDTSPWWGEGYMGFWSGWRLQTIWQAVGVGVNQAHNGYLEQYLNLGAVGIGLLLILLLGAIKRNWQLMMTQSAWGSFLLTVVIVAMVYNISEATFYGLNILWVMLLLAVLHPCTQALASNAYPVRRPS